MENSIIDFDIFEWPDEPEMFSELPDSTKLEEKQAEVAADLAGLMAYAGFNQSDLVSKLQWKKSRVSTVLSGRSNLTLGKIWEFVDSLGYDFDVVFRAPKDLRSLQPWSRYVAEIVTEPRPKPVALLFQTAEEVSKDLTNGICAESGYVSVKDSRAYSFVLTGIPQNNLVLESIENSHNWEIKLDVNEKNGALRYE